MSKLGHNERSYRLDTLAAESSQSLGRVLGSEENAIGAWLAYGHALNEARALFPGDKQFGEWMIANALHQVGGADGAIRPVHDLERAAAMWAAANADQFEEARQRGNPRTIRGIHTKWKEIEAEREAERFAEEQRQAAEERKAAQVEEIPSERTNREDGAIGREGHAPDGSSRLSAGRTADPSDTGETVEEGDDPAAGESPALESVAAPDPHAKLRREFQSMTPEAQEDDWIGLRADVAELRKRVSSQTSMIADLKRDVKELADTKDLGPVVSNLKSQLGTVKLARDNALTAAKRMEYRLNKAEARVKDLESMGVAY